MPSPTLFRMTTPEELNVAIVALGVEILVVCEDADLAHRVRTTWVDALSSSGRPARFILSAGLSSACQVTGNTVEELLHHLSPAVTLRAIEGRAGELVMLHAAALADLTSGATAVLVAPSGTGKTTASVTLGQRLAYLSDETSGIEADGILTPYRKPLSIIRTGEFKDQVAPSSLGMLTTERPCHLAALLVIERDPSHGCQPKVSELKTIDALALLAPQASSLGKLDRPLQRVVQLIESVGGVRRVTYSEASTLEPVVTGLLSGAHS